MQPKLEVGFIMQVATRRLQRVDPGLRPVRAPALALLLEQARLQEGLELRTLFWVRGKQRYVFWVFPHNSPDLCSIAGRLTYTL